MYKYSLHLTHPIKKGRTLCNYPMDYNRLATSRISLVDCGNCKRIFNAGMQSKQN